MSWSSKLVTASLCILWVQRLFREGCPIDQRELEALDGYAEFAEREAAREAKKLDQRRGETGDALHASTTLSEEDLENMEAWEES